MRVITGTARGRKLKTPEGMDVRPTSDMVKEAMFSSVQFDVEQATVLDLFSGTGQLGIEALSRGAAYCFFADSARASYEITKENLALAGFSSQARVVHMDSLDFLRSGNYTYDLAFLDPPYENGIIEKALPILEKKMNEGGKVLCEHEVGLVLPDEFGCLKKKKTYRYGKIGVTLYVKEEEA